MSVNKFFPPRPESHPAIYAYEDTPPQYAGLLKVGYPTADAQSRVAQQYPTLRPGNPPYRIVLEESAMSGTTATLLARRWESALLVNVDNGTLQRLMDNEAAMEALMSIEGFRNLNQDIETIINKSEAVKKAQKDANDEELSAKEKKELSAEEKEYKSLRKQIQENLIKFATRLPIFMYLTDYREWHLKDVISQLEPGLFKKVTGLTVKDFELLVSLNVFNSALMNDAVYKFKRYEDASLSYTGINKHEDEDIGLYDTVLTRKEAQKIFENVTVGEGYGT